MLPEMLAERLNAIKNAGIINPNRTRHVIDPRPPGVYVHYSMRGDPLHNPQLAELTAVVRKAFPTARIQSFWTLTGLNTQQELEKRTVGLDELILSIDAPHFAGIRRLYGVNKADFEAYITERLRWVKAAAAKNEFRVITSTAGRKKEQAIFTAGITRAAEKAGFKAKLDYKPFSNNNGAKRNPAELVIDTAILSAPGRLKGLDAKAILILHDCTITDRYPE
ncbi:MAG: hypothetical protein AABW54_03125 [Candidatus Micrarchaeota archaeon]